MAGTFPLTLSSGSFSSIGFPSLMFYNALHIGFSAGGLAAFSNNFAVDGHVKYLGRVDLSKIRFSSQHKIYVNYPSKVILYFQALILFLFKKLTFHGSLK